jgi:nucleoid DNA-binding protein
VKETAIKDTYSKSQILNDVAADTGLTRKEVQGVLDSLENIMRRHLKNRGSGEFKMPGLFKVRTVKKPAQAARKGVPNPFRPGETMDIAAKPASKRIKIAPLKGLKDMIA